MCFFIWQIFFFYIIIFFYIYIIFFRYVCICYIFLNIFFINIFNFNFNYLYLYFFFFNLFFVKSFRICLNHIFRFFVFYFTLHSIICTRFIFYHVEASIYLYIIYSYVVYKYVFTNIYLCTCLLLYPSLIFVRSFEIFCFLKSVFGHFHIALAFHVAGSCMSTHTYVIALHTANT